MTNNNKQQQKESEVIKGILRNVVSCNYALISAIKELEDNPDPKTLQFKQQDLWISMVKLFKACGVDHEAAESIANTFKAAVAG